MFVLQIQCNTIEEAERALAAFKHSADPSAVKRVSEQLPLTATEVEASRQPARESAVQSAILQPMIDAATAAVEPTNPRGRPRRKVAPPLTESATPASSENVSVEQSPGAAGDAPAPQTHTLDDAKAALRGMQQRSGTNDLAKPLALLGKFGAARISEVKPADYADFIEACNKA